MTSLFIDPPLLEAKVKERFERYERLAKARTSFEAVNVDKADLILVAYGTSARVCLGAIQAAKEAGVELGLLRPISLWPFPKDEIAALAARDKRFLVVEMSMGQMVEDVRLAASMVAGSRVPAVDFFGRCGGIVPSEEEVLAEAKRIMGWK